MAVSQKNTNLQQSIHKMTPRSSCMLSAPMLGCAMCHTAWGLLPRCPPMLWQKRYPCLFHLLTLLNINHCDPLYKDLQKYWLLNGMFPKFKAASKLLLVFKIAFFYATEVSFTTITNKIISMKPKALPIMWIKK